MQTTDSSQKETSLSQSSDIIHGEGPKLIRTEKIPDNIGESIITSIKCDKNARAVSICVLYAD